jgi:DNA polymerase
VFVGEAPGADEDRQGQPFVGEAGQILTRLIEAMGLKRPKVYICNVLKCRPPANRNPHKDEIAACSPFLQQQLQIIKPEVIVALGTFAAQTLLDSKEPISRMRGQFHSWHGIPVMPTFHPSFLLHNKENKQHYWDVWSDMEQVLHKLKLPVPEKKKKA